MIACHLEVFEALVRCDVADEKGRVIRGRSDAGVVRGGGRAH
jgi:hypothetical protein